MTWMLLIDPAAWSDITPWMVKKKEKKKQSIAWGASRLLILTLICEVEEDLWLEIMWHGIISGAGMHWLQFNNSRDPHWIRLNVMDNNELDFTYDSVCLCLCLFKSDAPIINLLLQVLLNQTAKTVVAKKYHCPSEQHRTVFPSHLCFSTRTMTRRSWCWSPCWNHRGKRHPSPFDKPNRDRSLGKLKTKKNRKERILVTLLGVLTWHNREIDIFLSQLFQP